MGYAYQISNYSFQEKKPIDYLIKCNERNSIVIQQVLKNNTYLLKKNKLTQGSQILRLKEQGVKISASGISRYKKGIYKTCALTYLQIFAQFWSRDLKEMMSEDFEAEVI